VTQQYSAIPAYEQRLLGPMQNTQSVWYRFFNQLWTGVPPSAETAIAVTASPFTYAAPKRGFVIVNGGTVSLIKFTRSASYTTGQTQGVFPVSSGDMLTVTYSALPTMTFVPQ